MRKKLSLGAILNKINKAPVLLNHIAFERPQYIQMLDLVQDQDIIFFLDYSPDEKFYIMSRTFADNVGVFLSGKVEPVASASLSDQPRRYLTHASRDGILQISRKGHRRDAVLISEQKIEELLGEYYKRPKSPKIPYHMKPAEQKAFAVKHNERIFSALTPPAPEGPGADGPG